jgi:hypothetical protein
MALFLVACGGDQSTAPEGSESASANKNPGGDRTLPVPESEASPDSGAQESGPDRGTVSRRSASFQKHSAKGKLHLAEFGAEARRSERSGAQSAVAIYLAATRESDWSKACNYLASMTKTQLAAFRPPGHADSLPCPQMLPIYVKAFSIPGGPVDDLGEIASLRIKQGAGFALFHGVGGEDRWLAVKHEHGKWKVITTAPMPFP